MSSEAISELLRRVDECGLQLTVTANGKLRLEGEVEPPEDLMAALRERRDEIIAALKAAESLLERAFAAVDPALAEDPAELCSEPDPFEPSEAEQADGEAIPLPGPPSLADRLLELLQRGESETARKTLAEACGVSASPSVWHQAAAISRIEPEYCRRALAAMAAGDRQAVDAALDAAIAANAAYITATAVLVTAPLCAVEHGHKGACADALLPAFEATAAPIRVRLFAVGTLAEDLLQQASGAVLKVHGRLAGSRAGQLQLQVMAMRVLAAPLKAPRVVYDAQKAPPALLTAQRI